MNCPNCGGGVVHLYFGGGKGEWRCLAGCGWTSRNGGKKCVVCGAPNAYLCDYPVADGKTCDAPLCWRHTWKPDQDKDIDYCPAHKEDFILKEQEDREEESERAADYFREHGSNY